MKTTSIFKMELAAYLMTKGFPCVGVTINHKSGFLVFLFQDSELLHEYIKKFSIDEEFKKLIEKQDFKKEQKTGVEYERQHINRKEKIPNNI